MNGKTIRNERRPDWIRAACMIFCALAAVSAAYIIFKHLFAIILPLLIGAGVGMLSTAIAAKLKRHTHASQRLISVAVLIVLLLSLAVLLFFCVKRLVTELGRLAEGFAEGTGPLCELFEEAAALLAEAGDRIAALLPGTVGDGQAQLAERINAYFIDMLRDALSALAAAIPGMLTSILSAIPNILLGVIVAVIAAFYFTLDSQSIKAGLKALLPSSACRLLTQIKKEAAAAAVGYLRSYSLIMLITFAEIFFGLSVLGVEYSFLIAAISAIVDILPVLGAGTVLIPWALFCLISHELFLGIGLIILYVVIILVRQFIEPKLVGESLGLHPLVALVAFYLGYRLFGFAGILIAPLLPIAWRIVKQYSDEEGSFPTARTDTENKGG